MHLPIYVAAYWTQILDALESFERNGSLVYGKLPSTDS